eukprot:3709307-Prymnesium_polylepis.1
MAREHPNMACGRRARACRSLNSWVRAAIGASIQTAQGQAHSYASNLVGNLRTKSRAVKIWRQSISVGAAGRTPAAPCHD